MVNVARPSEVTAGGYFTAKDQMNAIAIVVEGVKNLREGVENNFEGQVNRRDEAIATVTIFNNTAQLEGKQEPVVQANVVVAGNGLVRPLKAIVGTDQVLVGKVNMVKARVGKAYVFEDVESDVLDQVVAYLEKRGEKREEAKSSMPSFD